MCVDLMTLNLMLELVHQALADHTLSVTSSMLASSPQKITKEKTYRLQRLDYAKIEDDT